MILTQSSSKTVAHRYLYIVGEIMRVKYSILYWLEVCVATAQLCVNVHPLILHLQK